MRTRRNLRSGTLIRGFALCVAAVLFCGISATAMPRAERHEVRHEIDQLEDNWRAAMIAQDVKALSALLADDYMGITANGALQTRDDLLASVRSGSIRFRSVEVSDRKIRFYGSTALVTSRAEVTGTGSAGDFSGSYRYTHVYARSATGNWQIVSFEASRIRDDDRH